MSDVPIARRDSVKNAVIGDRFMSPAAFVAAIRARSSALFEIRAHELSWPDEPMRHGYATAGLPFAPFPGTRRRVRFRGVGQALWMAGMAKVFGCREAYENRPSTNPRACGADLWRFRVLAERDDGGVG
ncbi:MAG: hypothetical protein ABSF67_16975, partial [Roseiarcus sp.]